MTISKKIIIGAILMIGIGISGVQAAGIPTPPEGSSFGNLPEVDTTGGNTSAYRLNAVGEVDAGEYTITEAMRTYINFFLGLVATLLLIALVYGGWKYMSALSNADSATEGAKAIQLSVIGLVIVILSYAGVELLITGLPEGDVAGNSEGICAGGWLDCQWIFDDPSIPGDRDEYAKNWCRAQMNAVCPDSTPIGDWECINKPSPERDVCGSSLF